MDGEAEEGDEDEEDEDGEEEEEESEDEEMETDAKPKINGSPKKQMNGDAKKATPEKSPQSTPESGDKKKKKKNKKKNKNKDTATPTEAGDAKTPAKDQPKVKPDQKTPAKAEQKTPGKDAKKTPGKTPKRTLKGGVQVEDLKEGNGPEAKRGKMVGMFYEGKLKSNGKTFDKNLGGKPFKFRLGAGEVIKGWDVGLDGIKVGGKRRLIIPASFAYGKQGAAPEIPPNATLVFDVECKTVN